MRRVALDYAPQRRNQPCSPPPLPATPRCTRADKVRGLDNSKAVRGFADTLSVAPLTYSLCRGDLYFVVFCLATPADAQAFCDQFGGMLVITGLHALPRDALHKHDHMTRDQRRLLPLLSRQSWPSLMLSPAVPRPRKRRLPKQDFLPADTILVEPV